MEQLITAFAVMLIIALILFLAFVVMMTIPYVCLIIGIIIIIAELAEVVTYSFNTQTIIDLPLWYFASELIKEVFI